jgi:uncharacterized protein (UPF0332 family)
MATSAIDERYFEKTVRSLAGAESEFVGRRYENCANRCYYACFQAAIAALIRADVRPQSGSEQWAHTFVQSQFVGVLINRRKLYPSGLRDVVAQNQSLRQTADYDPDPVTEIEAARRLRRSRTFVEAIRRAGGIVQ